MAGMSVNQFREQLRKEVDEILIKKGLVDSDSGRGHALEYWLASLLSRLDRGLETEPDDAVLIGGDGGIDALMQDGTRKCTYLLQAKWQSGSKPIDDVDVSAFFGKHSSLMDKKWIRDRKSVRARDALAPYREMIEDGFTIKYVFVSTGKTTADVIAVTEKKQKEYQTQGLAITCEVWDFHRLKENFDRAQKQERQTPEEVKFKLQRGNFHELVGGPLPMLIGAIGGNELRSLYHKSGDALFAYNIRQFLGSRGINKDIAETADADPEHFLYFNNGITAICTYYSVDDNEVLAKGFQIVNGAQTVGALAAAEDHTNLLVQFRLIKAADVKTDTGINREIIQYNNTQNPVRLSDFRSNDPIQTWLETEFKAHRWKGKEFKYTAKRGGILRGFIGLEEVAKIIWTFWHEPTLVFASPKDLWTRRDEGGKYEDCFGTESKEVDSWDSNRFGQLTFAVTASFFIAEKIHAEVTSKTTVDLSYLKRLKYHALALLGERCRSDGSFAKLTDRQAEAKVTDAWPDIKHVLIDQNLNYRKNNEMTLFAFIRNTEVWAGMKERLLAY